jgi:hypothetical protein
MARIESIQAENREDGSINAPLLLGAEMAGQVSKPADVDGAHLFHQDLGFDAFDLDLGSEGRSSCTHRRGCDQNHRPGEERVRLDDNAISFSKLLMPNAPGKSKTEDVTPAHAGSP